MKELDVLLEKFLAETYETLLPNQQAAFQRLLAMEDPDLHACLIGQQSATDTEMRDVIERIRHRA
ncbi:MAG: succinate dehydrogenase assembly factor 2 [Nevskiales bacterium]